MAVFFYIVRHFVTKLHNFTKVMMLFPAAMMTFRNSKVRLEGKRSITTLYSMVKTHQFSRW
jgi:hypothetical protein